MLKPHATLPGLPPITLLRRPFLLLASSSALPRPLLTTHGEQVSHQLRHMLPGTCDCARTPGCTNDFHTLLATHLLSATAGLPPTELTLLASLPSSGVLPQGPGLSVCHRTSPWGHFRHPIWTKFKSKLAELSLHKPALSPALTHSCHVVAKLETLVPFSNVFPSSLILSCFPVLIILNYLQIQSPCLFFSTPSP